MVDEVSESRCVDGSLPVTTYIIYYIQYCILRSEVGNVAVGGMGNLASCASLK